MKITTVLFDLDGTLLPMKTPGFQKPFCLTLTDVADLVQLFQRNYRGI